MSGVEYNIEELDTGLIDILVKAGQLRMYKHFEAQLKRNGSITYEQYVEQIKPAVELLQGEIDKRTDKLGEVLDRYGL